MWAPFGHHFTENNAFHQDMEKAAKPSNHAALRPFSVHIKHVENDTKIYYFLWCWYISWHWYFLCWRFYDNVRCRVGSITIWRWLFFSCIWLDMPCSYYIEEEMKKENYDDNENLMSAEGFLDFLQKNRRTVPNEKRLANKEKFIWAVRELSEAYEIDADLIEDDDGYTASLFMNYASYNGYIKKLLGLIFILSDDFSMFKAKDNRDSDLLMCFTYHTHNVYLKDREITDFE